MCRRRDACAAPRTHSSRTSGSTAASTSTWSSSTARSPTAPIRRSIASAATRRASASAATNTSAAGWRRSISSNLRVQTDTGGSQLASRETFVGLQNDWGTLKLGKFLTPYDDIHPIFGNAPTLTTSVLSTAALWAQGSQSKGQGGFDARLGNSIRYDSPTSNGFTGEMQYSTRDSSGNADGPSGDNGDHSSELRHANVWSLGGFYSNGPVDLGIAFERNDRVRGVGRHDDALSVSGAYDFGDISKSFNARVAVIYERLKYDTLDGNLTRDFYGVSATVPAGGGWIYGFWGHAGDGKGSTADGTQVGAAHQGSRDRQRPVGGELLVQPVAAHSHLCRLRADQQSRQRSLHLQYQRLRYCAGGQARRDLCSAWRTSSRVSARYPNRAANCATTALHHRCR